MIAMRHDVRLMTDGGATDSSVSCIQLLATAERGRCDRAACRWRPNSPTERPNTCGVLIALRGQSEPSADHARGRGLRLHLLTGR